MTSQHGFAQDRGRSRVIPVLAAVLALLLVPVASSAAAATTSVDRVQLVSRGADGAQLNRSGESGWQTGQSVSSNGATVTFRRHNSLWVYEERLGHARQLVSEGVTAAKVSADGRWVAYVQKGRSLAPDGWSAPPTFVRVWDLATDSTQTLYQSESYEEGDADYDNCDEWGDCPWVTYTAFAEGTSLGSISADGRYVTYTDARVDNRLSGRLWRVDRDSDGNGTFDEAGTVNTAAASVANGRHHAAYNASMSGDGRRITFSAPIIQQETRGYWHQDCLTWDEDYMECLEWGEREWLSYTTESTLSDQVYVRDMQTETTTLVSDTANGDPGNGDSSAPQIAANGHHVLFRSSADDLAGNDGAADGLYVRDLRDGTTTRVASGLYRSSNHDVRLTPDGRNIVYTAPVEEAPHPFAAYITEVGSTTSQLITGFGASSGEYDGGRWGELDEGLGGVAISDNGGYLTFATNALNVVPDFDVDSCVFVRENHEEDDDPLVDSWQCLNVYRADLRLDSALPDTAPKTQAQAVASPVQTTTVATNTSTSIADPIGASVTVPAGTAGGTVSINEDTIAPQDAPPTGYELFGHMVEIHAPAGSMDNPLRLSFSVHASLVPEGQPLDSIVIFRNAQPLDRCPGATTAATACLTAATFDEVSQTYRFEVLTPQASRWTMGYRVAPPVVAEFAKPLESSTTGIRPNKVAAGRTIPIKVTLNQGDTSLTGSGPVAPTLTVSMMSSCTVAAASAPMTLGSKGMSSTTGEMRWSASDGLWIYNLDSRPLQLKTDTCYRVDVMYGSEQATASAFAVLTPNR